VSDVAGAKRISVIDDDDNTRKGIQRLLDAAGFDSVGYASAEEMLADGACEDVVCVVSDQKMPGISGLELLAELHARGRRSPFILITGHDSPRLRVEAHRRGAAYLAKPFVGPDLLDAIKATLNSTKSAEGSRS
jgi:two-component system, LuxR family, response regulator FixJ